MLAELETRFPNLVKAATRVGFANGVDQLGVLIRTLVLAHFLTLGEMGIAAAVVLVVSLASTATNLGVSQFLVQSEHASAPEFRSTMQLVELLRGFLCGSILFLSAPILAALVGSTEVVDSFRLAAFVPMLKGAANVGVYYAERTGDFRPWSLSTALAQIVSLVCLWPALLILSDHQAVVLILLVHSLVFVAVSWVTTAGRIRFRFNTRYAKLLKSFGLPLLLNSIFLSASLQLDRGLVAGVLTPEDFANYSIAALFAMNGVGLVKIVVDRMALPILSGNRRSKESASIVAVTHETYAVLASSLALGFLLFSNLAINLMLDARYETAAELLVLLGCAHSVRAFRAFSVVVSISRSVTTLPLYANLIRAGCFFATLGFALVQPDLISARFVAWSCLVSEFITLAATLVIGIKVVRIPIAHSLAILSRCASIVLMVAWVRFLLDLDSLSGTIFLAVAGVAVLVLSSSELRALYRRSF